MQNTCYVHSQMGPGDEIAFVMRTERFMPEWNRKLREVVGEDNVHQLEVCGGKKAWAVPWKWLSEVITLAKQYFDSIVPERESLLGFEPFATERLNALGALLEKDERPKSDDPKWMWTRTKPGATSEFHAMPMKVVEVGAGNDGKPCVALNCPQGQLSMTVTKEEARLFGARLYDWVMVTVREPKEGEISGD